MKREHLKLIIPGVILLIALAVLQQRVATKRGKENFRRFYNAEIRGRIEKKVSASKGSSRFKINGQEYSFHPYTSDLNDNSIFEYVAQACDLIVKGQGHDSPPYQVGKDIKVYIF